MEYWKKEKVLQKLKISSRHLKKLQEQGAPPHVKFKGYDIKALCEWIITRPQKRQDRTKIRERAEMLLNQILSILPSQEINLEGNSKQSIGVGCKFELGLLPALDRARQTELKTHEAHIEYFKKTGLGNASLLKTWQAALDLLRNCEKDFEGIERAQRKLIPVKDVQDFLGPLIEQAKTMLLEIPGKIARDLEGMPWQETEKILDHEIREALERIGKLSHGKQKA